ncbi:MAG: DNA/RNA endonuclease YhcR with UshA esterase domain [Verrucomicrobiales bacterium]|jgi:DNA/RNA endonuclease YhcR with UshA esterase domain
MMNSNIVMCVFCWAAAIFPQTALADETKPKPAVIAVTDAEKIPEQLGKEVTVRGKVTRTGESSGGIQFLNFANYHFVVVCFSDDVVAFKEGKPVDLYKDQVIEVTGTVDKYRDRYQIKLKSPDQIKIVPAKPGETLTPDDDPKKAAPESPKEDQKDGTEKPVDPKKFFDC